MKAIKAIYNFIVGDMIILIGMTITFVVLALINFVNVLTPLSGASAYILIIAVLVVLTATLMREARGKQ